ncbi:MAG: prepilin peptidase [Acidobacteriales bacterium]|nr:prepilin peptidase [Terriglobales bacterium]
MLETFLAFLFGLLIGSFLNVCIYRMPEDLSVVRPRSFCPACKHTIPWYDNIPLVSYALLRAKCRWCGERISARYPIVEALTGALFAWIVFTRGVTPLAAKDCVFAALMVGLIFTDLEQRILPDELTLGGALAGVLIAVWVPLDRGLISFLMPYSWNPRVVSVVESAASALLISLLMWGIGVAYLKVRKREGLGLGDVKMIATAGAFLGLEGALLMLMIGSLLGSVVGYAYIRIAHKNSSTYELPFGSFLGVAALVVSLLRLGAVA